MCITKMSQSFVSLIKINVSQKQNMKYIHENVTIVFFKARKEENMYQKIYNMCVNYIKT